MNLKLIITDFDGTLVNTFEANYQAYAEAFTQCDRKLTRDSRSEEHTSELQSH